MKHVVSENFEHETKLRSYSLKSDWVRCVFSQTGWAQGEKTLQSNFGSWNPNGAPLPGKGSFKFIKIIDTVIEHVSTTMHYKIPRN